MGEETLAKKQRKINSGLESGSGEPEERGINAATNALNRDITLFGVKRRLEGFQNALVSDVQRKMDGVVEDIIQEIKQYELNHNEFKGFAQQQYDEIWSNRIKTDPESKDRRKKLPEKVFVPRESFLTSLLEVYHMRCIYHIFLVIFSVVLAKNMMRSVLSGGSINFGFETVKIGFGHFDYVIAAWTFMQLCAFGLYYAFRVWAQVRFILRNNSFLQGLWSYTCVLTFVAFQISLGCAACIYSVRFALPLGSSAVVLMEATRFMMKMHAFVRSNVPVQLAGKLKSDKGSAQPVDVVPFSTYCYFLFVPTLIYRDTYPRTKQIRRKFVARKVLEFVAILLFLSSIHDCYLRPYFQDFGKKQISLPELIETGFAMIMPGLLIFLCGFFCILHIVQNLFAELLMFADRMFYKDWWTATNYEVYFRNWNVVIHDWLYEYIYKDMYTYVCKGSKTAAALTVFLVSAVVHEIILACGLKFFYPVLFSFFGILSVALVFLTKRSKSHLGNLLLWWSISVGNGITVSLYTVEYYARQNCPVGDSWADYLVPVSWYCNGLTLNAK